ncbi:hypothetical protein, partial [Escherichia coli]|uniref:hypothetical protein n=1 Tax=Escherichia coli TaxID=562 RepID=UPI0010FFDE13
TGFLHGVTAPFLIGARSVLLDIFTPDACLALLEQQRCTCMLGFRGAGRYVSDSFRDCFALECEAVKRVRNDMGLTNVEIMI